MWRKVNTYQHLARLAAIKVLGALASAGAPNTLITAATMKRRYEVVDGDTGFSEA